MPAVLVHGVPETPVVWDPLRACLSRTDVAALRLPGFGAPAPSGFKATKEDYMQWLTAELEREGISAFCDSYNQLLACITSKLAVVGAVK